MKGFAVRFAVCAAALIAASGASAQEGVAMKNLLGSIGIIPKDPPKIEYRERAPLVLPPKMELRAPVDPTSVEARAPNWPKDPDVTEARRAAIEEATPEMNRQTYRLNEGKRLSVDEMRAGRRIGGGQAGRGYGDKRDDKSRMTPEELRLPQEAASKLDPQGLKRRYISDPPQALLTPADGAPLRASREAPGIGDQESPYAFQRQIQGQYSR